jgi:hypothetical protein
MNLRKSIRPTPATSVTNVRTIGTNRARISARLPYFSKKMWVLVTYLGLRMRPNRPVRGLNSGGPINRPIQ